MRSFLGKLNPGATGTLPRDLSWEPSRVFRQISPPTTRDRMAISCGETPQRTSRGIQRLGAAAASSGGERSLPRSASAELAQGAAARCAAPGPAGRCRAARGEGAGSARRLPARRLPYAPAHPAPPEQGHRAARSPAAAAGSSSATGSPAATWTRVRRPRIPPTPSPLGRPEAGLAHPCLGPGLPFSFCPLPSPHLP